MQLSSHCIFFGSLPRSLFLSLSLHREFHWSIPVQTVIQSVSCGVKEGAEILSTEFSSWKQRQENEWMSCVIRYKTREKEEDEKRHSIQIQRSIEVKVRQRQKCINITWKWKTHETLSHFSRVLSLFLSFDIPLFDLHRVKKVFVPIFLTFSLYEEETLKEYQEIARKNNKIYRKRMEMKFVDLLQLL